MLVKEIPEGVKVIKAIPGYQTFRRLNMMGVSQSILGILQAIWMEKNNRNL